jgi:uncharacterized protein YbdZ (MbtH family)
MHSGEHNDQHEYIVVVNHEGQYLFGYHESHCPLGRPIQVSVGVERNA